MIYIQQELERLKQEVLDMWDLVSSQLNRAGEALLSLDKEMAREVTCREKRVNAFELKIDSDCEDIIALYNPRCLRPALYSLDDEDKHKPRTYR